MAKTKTRSKKSAKPAEPTKSHRGGKAAAIIVLVLVLFFGVLAVWFFGFYNNPEKVASDAVRNLFSAENVSLQGGANLWLSNEAKADSPVSGAILSFDSSSDKLPSSNSAKLQLIFDAEKVQGEPKVLITLKNVTLRDGVIYFQIGGIMDSLGSFNYSLDEWSALEDYLPLIETVDNEWWRIDVRDIVASLELPSQQQNGINKIYSCVVDVMNRDNSAEMVQVYQDHRFINVIPAKQLAPEDSDSYTATTSWHNAYEITINRNVLADYINAIPETAAAEEFYTCFNQAVKSGWDENINLSASSIDEISAEDIDWPDSLRIFAEVSTFGHKLRSLYLYQDTEGYNLGGSALFNYQAADVSTPESYRPVSDLFEDIIELISQNVPNDEES